MLSGQYIYSMDGANGSYNSSLRGLVYVLFGNAAINNVSMILSSICMWLKIKYDV